MLVDYLTFLATDGVELRGWLTDTPSNTAVLHIHGKGGNGYERPFLYSMHHEYSKQNVSLFSINTRGAQIIDYLVQHSHNGPMIKKGGSCYEIFDESVHDIQGAVNYLKNLGKTNIYLQGHSLGCSKIVYYMTKKPDISIKGILLIAPTDMPGWAALDKNHHDLASKARKLIAAAKPYELLGDQIGLDADPMSAIAYLGSYSQGSNVDI